jgi:GT2 family glycosyltransferase
MIGAPLRVRVVDRERPVDGTGPAASELAGADRLADGRRYRGAWVLLTSYGRPIGELEVEFPLDHSAFLAAARSTRAADGVEFAAGVTAPAPDSPDRPATPVRPPSVSIVLPTHFGRVELLRRAVATLTTLDYPDFEVLVVDNRPAGDDSSAPHLGPAGDDPRVRVVRARRPGISAARNAGIDQARGEIIAFTDDDVLVDAGWLRAIAERLVAEPDADGVTGLVLPAELETDEQVWFERSGSGPARRYRPGLYQVAARGLTGLRPWDARRFQVHDRYRAGPGPAFSLYQLGPLGTGANMAFRTSTLKEFGGFDESLGAGTPTGGGEDIAMFVRLLFAGGCLAFEPAAYVFHTHRRTYPELRRQVSGYGRGLTAMLSSLVRDEPRHVFGLLRVVLPGLRMAASHSPGHADHAAAGVDGLAVPVRDLRRARALGLLLGPAAYLLSRRRIRR